MKLLLLLLPLLPLAAHTRNVGVGTACPDGKAAPDATATGKCSQVLPLPAAYQQPGCAPSC